jgi:pimeloyl-ACP methyl ester carboxylesterase
LRGMMSDGSVERLYLCSRSGSFRRSEGNDQPSWRLPDRAKPGGHANLRSRVDSMHPLQSLNAHRLPAAEIVALEPLVFSHGYSCGHTMWTDVADRLPDFERWLFDWPGAGRAEPDTYDPSRHAHLEGYADDLLALVRSISQEVVTVVAHSVAASIAMLARTSPLPATDPRHTIAVFPAGASPLRWRLRPGHNVGTSRPT